MKILLDAMMPREIASALVGLTVSHVGDHGWADLSNGKLLTAAESAGFDVLITKDANMPYQQNMVGRRICLIVVRPHSQDIEDLLGLAPKILMTLQEIKPGLVIRIQPS